MRYRSITIVAVFALVAAVPAVSMAAEIFVSTDQTGKNVQCDISNTQHWTYTVPVNVDVQGGLFVMKDGQNTVADITFCLVEGGFSSDFTSRSLASTTLTPASFTQSYEAVIFTTPTITLLAGHTYTGVLSSSAAVAGDAQYFIKDGNKAFVDSKGTIITVPEPATMSLLALGGLAALLRKRR
ncbi:MAG: PEP-CTERM sorting domain-containing protein [Planctomycetaceae bacterium]|nr:PEP-CTERM sorting domain-containing protein [Planctomycetaceae bacterium]